MTAIIYRTPRERRNGQIRRRTRVRRVLRAPARVTPLLARRLPLLALLNLYRYYCKRLYTVTSWREDETASSNAAIISAELTRRGWWLGCIALEYSARRGDFG